MALDYGLAFMRRGGTAKLTRSAIVRHALLRYAASLSGQDPAAEHSRASAVSKALEPAQDVQQARELRLYAVPPEEPLPAFQAVLQGHDMQQRREAFDARVDRVWEALGV